MSDILIFDKQVTIGDLRKLAEQCFGDMVKAVVDIKRGIMAVGGELHADEEALLLDGGSNQSDLWGINIYLDKPGIDERLEFDSLINIRPSQGNLSRVVESPELRDKITKIVSKLVQK